MATKTEKPWKEIVNSGKYDISEELLHWSGLKGAWGRHGLYKFDFIQKIANHCDHIDFDLGNMADGDGGYKPWVEVVTDDEEALKKEMKARVEKLIMAQKKKNLLKKKKQLEPKKKAVKKTTKKK